MKWWNKLRGKTTQTLDEEVQEEAIGLDRDILHRELKAIEMSHQINADRAKQLHLVTWLQKRAEAGSLSPSQIYMQHRGDHK